MKFDTHTKDYYCKTNNKDSNNNFTHNWPLKLICLLMQVRMEANIYIFISKKAAVTK
jgi:hypothetical protein